MSEKEQAQEQEEHKAVSPGVKFALEMGPLVVFYIANYYGDSLAETYPALKALGGKIFIGTAFLMVAMVISLTLTWILERRIAIMPLITGIMVLVFGALTLYLHDDTFIKLKVTIVNVLFGTTILVLLYVFKIPAMKLVMEVSLKMEDEGWFKLSKRFCFFFFFLAALNEVVWRNFPTDTWINFKVWGIMPISMIFMMMQMPLLKKYAIIDEEKEKEA